MKHEKGSETNNDMLENLVEKAKAVQEQPKLDSEKLVQDAVDKIIEDLIASAPNVKPETLRERVLQVLKIDPKNIDNQINTKYIERHERNAIELQDKLAELEARLSLTKDQSEKDELAVKIKEIKGNIEYNTTEAESRKNMQE